MNGRIARILIIGKAPGTAEKAGAGFELVRADCLADGVKRCLPGTTDLVVLDLGPSAGDGVATLQAALAAMPKVPIVVLVDGGAGTLASDLLHAGAHACLLKGTAGVSMLLNALRFGLERKRADVQRLRVADHIQLLLESTGGGLNGVDALGRCTFINRAGAEMLGYRPEEMLGKTLHDLIHHTRADGSPHPWHECPVSAVLKTGEPVRRDDDVFWRKDGTTLVVGLSCRPVRENGVITGAVVTFNDISARKQAEGALKDSEALWRTAFENAPIGMALQDVEGRYLKVNRALSQMLGYSEEELLARRCADITHPDDYSNDVVSYSQLLEGVAQAQQAEKRYVHARGHIVHAMRNLALTGASGPGKARFIVQVMDISGLKRAEAERLALEQRMRETQRLQSLGSLAGGVAHDFNNLLTIIMGRMDMALQTAPAGSGQEHSLQEGLAAAGKAANLAQQMLMYSGKGRFAIRTADLNELVRALTVDAEQTIPETIRLQCQFAEGLPSIMADSSQIRQLLSNVVTNAVEAIGGEAARGSITISTGLVRASQAFLKDCYFGQHLPEGDYVFVEITDTGCGMDEKTRARIFDPFFSTKFTGRGLGLPSVSGIVRGHKGAIRIRSTVGAGTTFAVFLPASAAVHPANGGVKAAASPANAVAGAPSGQRILVVDDEEGVRDLTRMLLEQSGYTVHTAADGREGLGLLRRADGQMTGVVLDMTMPGMDGEETLRHMRQIRPDIPVLLMTGYSEDSMAAKFAGIGGVGFLGKPFKAAELHGKLSALLR